MPEIFFGDFRIIVIEHIKAVEAIEPEPQSVEWYFLRYLHRVAKTANPPTTPGSMENAMRALIRFYVDMIDENTELADRCLKINAEYRKALRNRDEQ